MKIDCFLKIFLHQTIQLILINLCQPVTHQKKIQSPCLFTNYTSQHVICSPKIYTFNILKADRDNRILPHIPLTDLSLLRNLQTVKKRRIHSNLEKALQHIHIQALPKPPGPCE